MEAVSRLFPAALSDVAAGLNGLQRLRFGERPARALVERLRELAPGAFPGANLGSDSLPWRMVRGGLLYAADAFEEAHAIFQEIDSAEGSYWHGMLHRREGDFGNAEYWVRRAGTVEALEKLRGFDPVAFVRACARADSSAHDPEDLLGWQRREWEALLGSAWSKLAQ